MVKLDWKVLDKKLQSVDDKVVLDTLSMIKESVDTERGILGKDVVDILIPQCIDKLEHHDLMARSYSLSILAQQYCLSNKHMEPYISDLCKQMDLPNLLDLQQGSSNVQPYTTLHQAMPTIISEMQMQHPDKIMPHFKPIANYLVECTAHANREIATAACNYWAQLPFPPVALPYMDIWLPSVLSKLGKLVPALLRCLIYQQEHLTYLEGKTNDNQHIPPELESYTNLRNFAALGFENICRIFQIEVTMKFKPYLHKWLNSDNWLETEAIILALGAFTEAVGTPRDFNDIYPEIIAKLLELYSYPKPLIRSITCFTMQRFMNAKIKNVKDPFSKMLKSTLSLLLDPHKEVHNMAIQSLSTMLAYANRDLTPHSKKIISALKKADGSFTGRERYIYYEAISHLFGRMGELLEKDEVEQLLHPIMTHWESIDLNKMPKVNGEQDESFVVCQPLCVITTYSKGLFEPYNDTIFEKVLPFVKSSCGQFLSDVAIKEVMTMRLVANIDLLSAMFDGQGSTLKDQANKYNLVEFVLEVLRCKSFQREVHQSALALLGHLCLQCTDDAETHQDEILKILIKNLDNESDPIRTNSLWALSHIVAEGKSESLQQLLHSKGHMVEILLKTESDETVIINAALVLTALAKHFPNELREVLFMSEVFLKLCVLLQRPFPRDQEKISIYKNFCQVIKPNMKKVSREGWIQFCVTAAVLDIDDEKLISTLRAILRDARSTLGSTGWNKVSQQLGPSLAIALRKRYKMY